MKIVQQLCICAFGISSVIKCIDAWVRFYQQLLFYLRSWKLKRINSCSVSKREKNSQSNQQNKQLLLERSEKNILSFKPFMYSLENPNRPLLYVKKCITWSEIKYCHNNFQNVFFSFRFFSRLMCVRERVHVCLRVCPLFVPSV